MPLRKGSREIPAKFRSDRMNEIYVVPFLITSSTHTIKGAFAGFGPEESVEDPLFDESEEGEALSSPKSSNIVAKKLALMAFIKACEPALALQARLRLLAFRYLKGSPPVGCNKSTTPEPSNVELHEFEDKKDRLKLDPFHPFEGAGPFLSIASRISAVNTFLKAFSSAADVLLSLPFFDDRHKP